MDDPNRPPHAYQVGAKLPAWFRCPEGHVGLRRRREWVHCPTCGEHLDFDDVVDKRHGAVPRDAPRHP
ncbi:hypothetical protein [Halobaculum sp. D14]|uniref:hypothetical protein n=1 Tax=Halobaculum sp. D14 TaxID=3421642 RepID=UPI003EBB15BD